MMIEHLRVVIPLWFLYVLLTANVEFSNWVVGVLIGVAVSSLVQPNVQWLDWRRLPGALMATGRYLLHLANELIVSGIQLAQIVLTPSLPMQQGIAAIPSDRESELATAVSTHAIKLTPGEMVVEFDDNNVMHMHMLDMSHALSSADYRMRIGMKRPFRDDLAMKNEIYR